MDKAESCLTNGPPVVYYGLLEKISIVTPAKDCIVGF